jgi:hypothetical protein
MKAIRRSGRGMHALLTTATVMLLMCVVSSNGDELWSMYQLETLFPDSSVVPVDRNSEIYFAITATTLELFQKYPDCIDRYEFTLDSIKNDTVYCNEFLLKETNWSVNFARVLYFEGDDLLWYEASYTSNDFVRNESNQDNRDTTIVRGYFQKTEISVRNELMMDLCRTTVVHRSTPHGIKNESAAGMYDLLGRKFRPECTLQPGKRNDPIHRRGVYLRK